jgi:hypothetical protein
MPPLNADEFRRIPFAAIIFISINLIASPAPVLSTGKELNIRSKRLADAFA